MTSVSARPGFLAALGSAMLALDLTGALLVVGILTWVVLTAMSPLPWPVPVLLGLWTVSTSLLTMPALAILYAATPRTPLSQRSALFASASWFGKAVWSGVVFVLSVVIGSVTGIVASRASEAESDMAMAIQLAFGATSQFVVWPVLATVVAIAYGVMGVRWFLDAGWLAEGGHAGQAVAWLERRWFPTRQAADVRSPLLLVELLLRIGQFALAATLLTVGLSAVTTIVRLLGP